jgi:uncharacterized coiled-coil DUF342 family protein
MTNILRIVFFIQEAEYQTEVDDITQDLELRDSQIKEMDGETSELRNNVDKLQNELQSKGQEILTIRREANSQIRYNILNQYIFFSIF